MSGECLRKVTSGRDAFIEGSETFTETSGKSLEVGKLM